MNDTLSFVLAVFMWFGGSAAIASLISLVIDILKQFGVVKDGDAGKWSAGLNLLGLVAFSVFFLFSPAVPFAQVEESLRLVLQIVQMVLALVMQLRVSAQVHQDGVWLAGAPGFFSYSQNKNKFEY